ncbi:MAG: TraB/GumN family protein [Candidatus Woesearchaeota archaeon]|nr:TraB/GumN family protein [Candidatus Woesearchaeota archaeon]
MPNSTCMESKNLIIIGTSHIAKESIKEVKDAIKSEKPAIVAVELDAGRYYSLKSSKKASIRLRDILEIGIVGFVFAVLGKWAQEKLGKLVGVMPGSEMLTAVNFAKKNGIEVRLIDQDIGITLKRLSKAITFLEELRFVKEIFKAIFFGKRELKRLGIDSIDLSKVPSKELIKKLIAEFRMNYPNVYRVLVTERNIVMAKRLASIMESSKEKKIIAVVGAGHEEELLELVKMFLHQQNNQNDSHEKITYSFSVG